MAKLISAYFSVVSLALVLGVSAQQKSEQQASKSESQPAKAAQATDKSEKKPETIHTSTVRLTLARNVFIVRTQGGKIPFDTIRTTIDGWQRFTLVDSAEKADLIIDVASSGGDDGVRVSSSMRPSQETGRMEESTSSSRDLSATEVSMTVLDAHNNRVLWRATESAKYAMRQKARENNLVEAAEKLASKFHDRLESPGRRK